MSPEEAPEGEETGRPRTELMVPEGPGGKGSWIFKERPQLESWGQVMAASRGSSFPDSKMGMTQPALTACLGRGK